MTILIVFLIYQLLNIDVVSKVVLNGPYFISKRYFLLLNFPFNNLALLFQFSKMIDILFFDSPFLQSLSGIVRFADRSRDNFGGLAAAFLFLLLVIMKEKKDEFVVEGRNSSILLGFIVEFSHGKPFLHQEFCIVYYVAILVDNLFEKVLLVLLNE